MNRLQRKVYKLIGEKRRLEAAVEYLAKIASSDGATCPYHELDHHGEAIYDDCLGCDTTEETAIKCWIKVAKEKT